MDSSNRAEAKQRIRNVETIADMLVANTKELLSQENTIPGYEFPKNSNVSKNSLKNQITLLRNELINLSKALDKFY